LVARSFKAGLIPPAGHASIQMTERYAHLAPDHLQNAIANLGFSSQFHLTENLQQAVVSHNSLFT